MEISCQKIEAEIELVCLKGRLDATATADVKATLQKLIQHHQPKIIIDLHHVPFIDSSGLAAIVSGLRTAREKGGNIALVGIQPQTQIIFRLTMLDRIFAIYSTIEEAQKAFS